MLTRRARPLLLSLGLAAGLVALAACRRTGQAAPSPAPAAPPPTAPADRPFHEGTAGMQQTARQLVAGVPGAPMEKRLDSARRLTAMGDPAVAVLIESLRHPDPAVRGFAAWTLGHAGDLRALPGLRDTTADPVKLVSLEAGAARVRLGDDGGLVRIVEGLDDQDPRVRARCIGILESRIGETFGYLPDESPSERAAAVERWRVFLRQRGLERPR